MISGCNFHMIVKENNSYSHLHVDIQQFLNNLNLDGVLTDNEQ